MYYQNIKKRLKLKTYFRNVTPLWAAYNNGNELLSNKNRKEIITLLLNNGATNKDTILLNYERVKIIDDILKYFIFIKI